MGETVNRIPSSGFSEILRSLVDRKKSFCLWLTAIFLAGLLLRIAALALPTPNTVSNSAAGLGTNRWKPQMPPASLEGDELVYMALTDQLVAGKGYTLRGHPLLSRPWIVREQYDRPLFFHPPGGIAFFLLMKRVAGTAGYALAQAVSFALFFWGVLLITWLITPTFNRIAFLATALLATSTPIMAHVMGRFWLDGPLLGFSTAATGIFLLGIKRRKTVLVCLAGLVFGYATLIKLTAFFALPGVLALGWVIAPNGQRRKAIEQSAAFVFIAFTIQFPWELWQWHVFGTAFPAWAGKPAAQLVQNNRFVHYVTVVRSPLIYVTLLPQVIWTLIPSLLLWIVELRQRETFRRGAALIAWIVVVLGANIVLACLGYSKLMRYAILVTPATVVLFGLVTSSVLEVLPNRPFFHRKNAMLISLLAVAIVGLSLEIMQGLKTSLVDNRHLNLVRPLTGL